MTRLFRIDEALTAEHAVVLKVIALEQGRPVDSFYIGVGASGLAVFYEDEHGTRCACGFGSVYWQECQARAVTEALLARLNSI